MNRVFTRREKIMLLILALVVLGMGYYRLIYQPIQDQIASCQANAQAEQAEIDANAMLVTRINQMEQELQDLKATGEERAIPRFDNSGAVMVELNQILSQAEDYSLSFGATEENDYIVQRPVTISFSVPSYDRAREIIDQLHDSSNINQIADLSIETEDDTQVYLTITYFEIIQEG